METMAYQVVVNVLGWVGTFLMVLAYYLISNKKLDASSPTYHILNIVGSVALGFNVFYLKAWPAVALEVVWAGIAIAALIKCKPKGCRQ